MRSTFARTIRCAAIVGLLCLVAGCDRDCPTCHDAAATPVVVTTAPVATEHAAPDAHAPAAGGHGDHAPKVSKADALAKLKDGNARYVTGNLTHPHQGLDRRAELAGGQAPFAIILGCADSRTSPEVLFDQGLGDLFVVRVAGNVVNDQGVGSIEYSVDHLGSRLIVVLGHKRCGAVKAARGVLAGDGKAPGHIGSLVEALKPAVDETKNDADMESTVKANVKHAVKLLRESGPILKEMVDKGELGVVGAYYDLDSGAVTFYND